LAPPLKKIQDPPLSGAMVSCYASNQKLGFLMKEKKIVMMVMVCYRLMKERNSIGKLLFTLDYEK
jgi:hypothetical protein